MKKYTYRFLFIMALLVVGASAVVAQGNGNAGRGNNNDRETCVNNDGMPCITDAQRDLFNYGGMNFVNPDTGEQWNDQSRGQMRGQSGQRGGQRGGQGGIGMYSMLPPASETPLTQAVIDLMIEGWVDEQHAYAVYQAVIDQFGAVNPFVNIQRAEAQHAASWELLFDRYDIAVPEVPAFELPTFASIEEACQIAVEAEIINFSLYDEMAVAFTAYPDILQVSTALRNASEFSHLPAFEACATP